MKFFFGQQCFHTQNGSPLRICNSNEQRNKGEGVWIEIR